MGNRVEESEEEREGERREKGGKGKMKRREEG